MSVTSDKSSRQNSITSDISDCNSNCSRASFTPTIDGGEPPFEEFAWSVQQLCKKFWPTAYEEVTITRLDGGTYNRIVGLSVKPSLALSQTSTSGFQGGQSSSDCSEHYILRVSREDDCEIANQITTLFYLQTHTTIPVPRVLAFDVGSDNVLERPYTLQQRLPGVPLESIIDKLTFEQRRGLAVQIARIIRHMQDVHNPVAGQIGIPTRVQHNLSDDSKIELQASGLGEVSLEKKLAFMTVTGLSSATTKVSEPLDCAEPEVEQAEALQVLHFDLATNWGSTDPYNGVINTVSNTETPVLSYFNFQFVRQMLQVLHHSSIDVCKTHMYHQLMQIVHDMDEDRCLGQDTINLYHGDFEPRNIMVHVCDFGDVHIAGVLDWDISGFVPQAVSCLAPRWVWSYKEELDSDERENEADPTDPEEIALKRLFDDIVGDDFLEMAYSPQGRMVRRLFNLSVGGIRSNEAFDEVENLVKEWAELRPTLKDDASDGEDTSDDEDASGDETPQDESSPTA